MVEPSPSLTVTQAAERLGIHRETLKRGLRAGRVHGYQTPGGHWRVTLEEIERITRGNRAPAEGGERGSP